MTSYTFPDLVKVWIFIRHRQIIFITILVFQGVKSKVPPGCNQWPAMRRLQSSSQRSHHSCYHFTQTSLLFHHHQHNHSNFSINYHTQYQYLFRCTTFPIHWLTLDFRIFTNFQWEWVKFPEKSGNERSRISSEISASKVENFSPIFPISKEIKIKQCPSVVTYGNDT